MWVKIVEMSSTPSNKKSAEIYGIGPEITDCDKEITGSELPTNGQILRTFLYYYNQQNVKTKKDAADSVIALKKPYYEKGEVLLPNDSYLRDKIFEFYNNDCQNTFGYKLKNEGTVKRD